MKRSTQFVIAGLLIALIVGGLLAEGAVRFVAAVDKPLGGALHEFDPMGVQIEPDGPLGYRQRPNGVLHYFNGTTASSNSMGFRGPVVAPVRPSGTIRVMLFGGSTTHGYAVNDDQTIDAYMRELLPAKYPGRQFEVVNFGFDGYDSYQDLTRLQADGIRLQPSIVIFNTGINDVRDAWYPNLRDADPRTLIWGDVVRRLVAEQARGGPTLWTRLKHYLYVARLPGVIRDDLNRRKELHAHVVATASPRSVVAHTGPDSGLAPPYPDAARFFERYIRSAVALSLQAGAGVLLSTPPSALRTYPPTATSKQSYWVWDAKTTQAYRDTLAARLRAIATDEHRAGQPVLYAAPSVDSAAFLDDCHLKPVGNRAVAAAFVDAIAPLVASIGASPRDDRGTARP